MSSDVDASRTGKARRIPIYRTLPALARNPLRAFEEIGRDTDGEVVQLDLGLHRPYLVSRPEDMQHVLRDRADNYVRDGMLWKPLRRLFGNGLGMDGPDWARSRQLMLPVFSARNVATIMDELTAALTEAVEELDPYARREEPIDTRVEMTRIIHRALIRVFIGDGMSTADADRLGHAVTAGFTSIGPRLLLPFVPDSVPLPGDGAFMRAVRLADSIVTPLVRQRQRDGATGDDLVSLLCRARDENGDPLDEELVRNDVVAMFAGASETSAVTLTWLWVVLDGHPEIAARVYDEVDRVIGDGKPGPAHVPKLVYTKQVLQELLRLYPVGWVIPRSAKETDVVGGVEIPAGSTVLASPYLTHRMERYWERPYDFDPERFSPERSGRRVPSSYVPFGLGAHQCLGSHFFMVEAQLIVAIMLSRYRVRLRDSAPVVPQAAATLRPRGRVEVMLSYRSPQ
ncbi:cytochrome P450 [Phytohabitans sp. ZYX-F-186]|uniref:Cytochrome P450 n=1 Tax=Phytohabitans maris TaxID=3071409 RepID=A0ABU0ZEV6_9ACTN|nr:cytochrome P450 [Phytohabitans sp. ZYX-F-186]MDQ7905581.1 cytochrome P450 [Phytohabitans sp. ZYX-F-186]